MIQFQVLSGKQAGDRWIARRFPVRIGRDSDSDLRLSDPGIWNRHCNVILDPDLGCVLVAQPDALLTVNREPQQTIRLRNGDIIELGDVRLRFWLADPVLRSFRLNEWFVWLLIAGIALGQAALAWWLIG